MGAAVIATFSLTGALALLKTALIATGVGALIVGAGALIAMFGRLVTAVGGFGEAMSLLGDVAAAVFQGIIDSGAAVPPALNGVWALMKGGFLIALSGMATAFHDFIWTIANGMNGIEGMQAVGASLMGLAKGASDVSGTLHEAGADAQAAAQGSFTSAAATISSAFGPARDAVSALSDAVVVNAIETEGAVTAADQLNNSLGEMGGGAAGKAAKEIKKVATEAEAFNKAMTDAAGTAEDFGKKKAGILISGVDGISNAFGDFIAGGLQDFKGFVRSIVDSFKSMLSQMIAMAVKNRIMIGLGFSGGGIGGAGAALAGAAGGGGPLGILGSLGSGGGMLGSIGGVLGTIGSNFGAGFMTSVYGGLGGLTGAVSGGLSVGGLAGISTAIGAIAAPLLAVAAVFSFFKKKTKELDSGLRVTVRGMDTLVQTFRTIETKRFWGLSKKVRTSFQNASDEIANPLIKAIGEMQGGIVDSAEALGISAAVFDGFAHTLQVSTRGMSDEAAQKAVIDAFERMGDAFAGLIPGLQALQKDGEGAMAAITRLAQSLIVVNARMADLGLNTYTVSLAGAGAAAAFVDLFGSLENFNAVSQSYYQNFFTDAERLARATELLSIEMLALGINALPSTRAAFRALIDEADALGNTGLVASLMQLSPAFAEISAGADALGNSLRSLVNEDLFATGQDFARSLSRSSNSQLFTPRESDAELRAELRALNVSMERLVSTSEITAGNTGRGADAADDTLAFQLEQTL